MILPDTQNGQLLPLADHFYSIQGEGNNAGKPVYFIRLGGCDVGCSWCDSKETWNPAKFPMVSVNEITSMVAETQANTVVITGGEPALYNLLPLCIELKKINLKIYLETSGSSSIIGIFDWITVSPKKNKPPLEDSLLKASELKVVIGNPEDFTWAETNKSRVEKGCRLYLQPEWNNIETMLTPIVDYALKNPEWSVSMQVHKYMNIK